MSGNDLRSYLRANMLDGDEDGTVRMASSVLLDEVCELVDEWLLGESRDTPATTVTHEGAVRALEVRFGGDLP